MFKIADSMANVEEEKKARPASQRVSANLFDTDVSINSPVALDSNGQLDSILGVLDELATVDDSLTETLFILLLASLAKRRYQIELDRSESLSPAAKFFSECRLVAFLLRSKHGARYAELSLQIEDLGAALLNQIFGEKKGKLQESFDTVFKRYDVDQISKEDIKDFQNKVVEILDVGIFSSWNEMASLLDRDFAEDLISDMIEEVLLLSWEWVMDMEFINKDALMALSEAFVSLASESSKYINDVTCKKAKLHYLEQKFMTSSRIFSQSLIQISNAYRRQDFSFILTLQELWHLVSISFPDNAMKSAFLAEIESDTVAS